VLRRRDVKAWCVIAQLAFRHAEHGRQLGPVAPRHGESIAHISPMPTPVARPAWLGIASEALVGAVRGLAASDAFAAYQRDSAAKLAMYLHHASEIGPELERQDIQDVNELVGGKFETWQQADAALEQFILRAGPECDRDLISLLYRRTQRQQALLEPVLSRPCVALSTKSLPELLNGG
jgi:hypothetical protein